MAGPNGRNGGRALDATDTAWWHMEQPDNQMTITAVMVFDGHLDFEHLHYLLATKLLAYDRFRERIAEPSNGFGQPMWVRDDEFSLYNHLRRVTLPPPGGRKELQDLVGALMSTPLDYRRPLWEYVYVDGYEDGTVLVARFHHCIADGIALVDLLLHMDDGIGPEAPVASLLQPRAGQPLEQGNGGGVLSLPFRAAASGLRLGGSAAGVIGKLLSMGNDAPTPLRGALSAEKRAAWSHAVPIEAIKQAARKVQGTVNDIVACSIAGSLHDYLKERIPLRPDLVLRAIVPVNLREPSEYGSLGNRFGLVWLPLPVGLSDPLERLRAIKRTMDRIKGSPEAHIVLGLLGFFGRTTRGAVHLAVQFLARGATLVFTNVPGPREPVTLCGCRMKELMAWVPQSGRLGLGMSVISYAGELRLGVASDASLVSDPELLVRAYHHSLEGVLDYAGAHAALRAAG